MLDFQIRVPKGVGPDKYITGLVIENVEPFDASQESGIGID